MTTPDIAGQCEKLRAFYHAAYVGPRLVNPDGPRAADTLERQAAENKRLREALDEADRLLVSFTGEGTATLSLSGKTQTRGDAASV